MYLSIVGPTTLHMGKTWDYRSNCPSSYPCIVGNLISINPVFFIPFKGFGMKSCPKSGKFSKCTWLNPRLSPFMGSRAYNCQVHNSTALLCHLEYQIEVVICIDGKLVWGLLRLSLVRNADKSDYLCL